MMEKAENVDERTEQAAEQATLRNHHQGKIAPRFACVRWLLPP